MSATLGTLMAEGVAALNEAGIENARMDVRILLARAAGVDGGRISAWPEDEVAADKEALFRDMIARRSGHEPVGRILGERDFWRHTFKLAPETLEPRPDSETLVEWAIDFLEDNDAPRIVDFGTGTGCLLLSTIGDLPGSSGIGLDISEGAVACARENARALDLDGQVEFRVSDWDSALDDRERADGFDLVMSNPPYITRDEMETLSPEVQKFDPRIALTDEGDGLAAYRVLSQVAFDLAKPGGFVIFEIGRGQEKDVGQLLVEAGFVGVEYREDLGGIVRCVAAKKTRCSVGRCVI
ncbi:peptide chain release factor N(5)-glutamine methyltransferase [Thalassospira sp. GO-4]|jgi:release factor glutamine methyltransferase|uniref:peptide chain release factor N(5)-glutamine methyltransferase n=1 Tax=Thalassospira TaxID=168934 RepID=UPI0007AD7074|nr:MULTISPECIES: peptide chain release factor N(5)-glutamine methyltransferase [unclassified Thalassospira]KZB60079.1 protein-(glutamine-N5) methyltransferase, release factor-specific [Thalassospira sp. MCCC 1A02491]MBO6772716.1 peptide chain release factor N(5)-glutamine methyltransferase [Thalassospira sp.]URK17812.1 peptide chain release factor N(5)-glutamine methyltransferase [Thalassospira sp. GO-4]